MANFKNNLPGCAAGGCTCVTGSLCSGIAFPDTMFMRTSFTYPPVGSTCALGKGGTVINSLWTFTHKTGTVWYFDGGFKTYTGNYWESDLQAIQAQDWQACVGFACPVAGRQYQIVCNSGRVTLVYYDFLASGDFPGAPWDELSHVPCGTEARSVGASFYHVLVSNTTSPFQLDFTTSSSVSAVITDV